MFWILLLIVFCFLFVQVDVWYFVSLILGSVYYRRSSLKPRTAEEFLEPMLIRRRVMPMDIDLFMHMNNARYLRATEFGRLFYSFRTGLDIAIRNLSAFVVLTATTVRYRRELRLFQSYTLRTSIVYWTDSDVYFEHRFETGPDSFVNCVSYAKVSFRNATVTDMIEEVCKGKKVPCPDPPKDLLKWIEYINNSSEQLRSENKKAK